MNPWLKPRRPAERLPPKRAKLKRWLGPIAAFGLLGSPSVAAAQTSPPAATKLERLPSLPAAVLPVLALKTSDGFAVPQPGHRFEFPRDHGSHPEFKIEWWYVTGHLQDPESRRVGFQGTFFRRAGPLRGDLGSASELLPAFGDQELHLAHMALVDVAGNRFLHEERLNRRGWDANASTRTLAVRNGNWSLGLDAHGALCLQGSVQSAAAFTLNAVPRKPLVVFGVNGVSRKGASPTAASYYLTFPRLDVSGELVLDGVRRPVRGQAWMDHEISSSQLDDHQTGWDWAGVQLADGREIMAYRLRTKEGRSDPCSQLAWVDAKGHVTQLDRSQFTWTALSTWKSRETGGVYPVRVRLDTTDPATGQAASYTLEPVFPGQELAGALGGIPYWEGACRVLDAGGREAGSAYLELTGYAGSLASSFR